MFFEKVESTGELELDVRSIVEWGDRWLVTFNGTKTKLFSFNFRRDPLLGPVEMNGIELPEETSFRLTFNRSMDLKPYMQSIATETSRKVGSLKGSGVSLPLNPSCICTNLPFDRVWSTVPISGVECRNGYLADSLWTFC